ncbi:MAG TPA: DinB family protein [Phnomibacter sp.]|nr:DinB family protein [Phnomibacter sp.]
MKKLLLAIPCLLLLLTATAQNTISKQERKAAINALKESEKSLEKAAEKLSPAQLAFEPAADVWGVGDCVKHLAAAEGGLRKMLDQTLASAPNPEKRSEVKVTDEAFVAMITSREKKVKTAGPMEPKNTSYKSEEEAMDAFEDQRADLIKLVKSTNSDLRNHIVQMPFGSIDAYQLILMIAAHTNRHIAQINEVKANASYPAK